MSKQSSFVTQLRKQSAATRNWLPKTTQFGETKSLSLALLSAFDAHKNAAKMQAKLKANLKTNAQKLKVDCFCKLLFCSFARFLQFSNFELGRSLRLVCGASREQCANCETCATFNHLSFAYCCVDRTMNERSNERLIKAAETEMQKVLRKASFCLHCCGRVLRANFALAFAVVLRLAFVLSFCARENRSSLQSIKARKAQFVACRVASFKPQTKRRKKGCNKQTSSECKFAALLALFALRLKTQMSLPKTIAQQTSDR